MSGPHPLSPSWSLHSLPCHTCHTISAILFRPDPRAQSPPVAAGPSAPPHFPMQPILPHAVHTFHGPTPTVASPSSSVILPSSESLDSRPRESTASSSTPSPPAFAAAPPPAPLPLAAPPLRAAPVAAVEDARREEPRPLAGRFALAACSMYVYEGMNVWGGRQCRARR
eukprot:311057-Chlamydomonas_euryale.AAC.2